MQFLMAQPQTMHLNMVVELFYNFTIAQDGKSFTTNVYSQSLVISPESLSAVLVLSNLGVDISSYKEDCFQDYLIKWKRSDAPPKFQPNANRGALDLLPSMIHELIYTVIL